MNSQAHSSEAFAAWVELLFAARKCDAPCRIPGKLVLPFPSKDVPTCDTVDVDGGSEANLAADVRLEGLAITTASVFVSSLAARDRSGFRDRTAA